jgi:hypothetical protein
MAPSTHGRGPVGRRGAGVGVSACPHYIPKLGGSIPNMGTRIGQLEIYEIEVGGP